MKLGKYMLISDKLTGEYKKTFDYMESYAGKHMVSGSYRNEKMMDILDILLTAQEQKTDIKRIVGTDLHQFSKDFFSDITFIDMIAPFFTKVCYWAWIILILEGISLLTMCTEQDFHFFTAETEISGFLITTCGILLAGLGSIILVKLNKYSTRKYVIMLVAFTIAGMVCAAFVSEGNDHRMTVSAFWMMVMAICYLVGYYVCKMFYGYAKTGSMGIIKNEYDTSFTGFIQEEVKQMDYSAEPVSLKKLSKEYERTNKKRVGKGIRALTTKEFLDKKDKQSRLTAPISYFSIAVIVILVELFVIDFNSTMDKIIFLGIMVCVYVLLYFVFFRSLSAIARKENGKIWKQCTEEGMEIDELYKKYIKRKVEVLEKKK